MAKPFTCETCKAPLRFHGGPHAPRWCPDHRPSGGGHSDSHRVAKDVTVPSVPAVYCSGCSARLLVPVAGGLCGFCIRETAQVGEAA